MLFSSVSFLFMFLPLTIIIYYIIGPSMRNLFLLVASLLFYAWGDAQYILIMLGVIIINYVAGRCMTCYQEKRKLIMWIAVLLNLTVLGIYKYTDFFIENINIFLSNPMELKHIALPIGISFYIFQSLSYTIDVYRGNVPAQKSFINFALYVSLFPQLVAGPIVKYRDIMGYIDKRHAAFYDIAEGLRRFIIGLGKKVLLANPMGEVADKVFAAGPTDIDMMIAWLGIVAYTLQIFFDFSGYSDMAIGLGRVFGFRFMENFNYPYISKSITEFWRRWHISLSTWFKEYVYIPLGGNRCSSVRRNLNLLTVFFVTGMWHGASWNFIIWGMWHGMFLLLEKKFLFSDKKSIELNKDNLLTSMAKHVYMILVVVIGFVIFRSDDMPMAYEYMAVMFGALSPEYTSFTWDYYFNNKVLIVGMISIACCYPWKCAAFESSRALFIARDVVLMGILMLSTAYVAGSGYNPFIYFRF